MSISDKKIIKRAKVAHKKLVNSDAAQVVINRLVGEVIVTDKSKGVSTHWRLDEHGKPQKIVFKYMLKLTPSQKRGLCNGDYNKVH